MRPESRRVVVRLKDGESHEVTEREVSIKLEGVEIVLSWRETSADSPDRSEVPSRWVLYPWHLLVLSLDDRDGSSNPVIPLDLSNHAVAAMATHSTSLEGPARASPSRVQAARNPRCRSE
jgi:hypothetical protein